MHTIRLLILMLIISLSTIKVLAFDFEQEGYKKVTVISAGNLAQALTEDEKWNVTHLKISGPINGTDWLTIQEMMGFKYECTIGGASYYKYHPTDGKLETLDLSDATIVAGGESFNVRRGYKCYTKDNTIVYGMFNFDPTNISYKLREVILPNSVTCVEPSAFLSVHNLRSVTFGLNMESIGGGGQDYAFVNCQNLESVIFASTKPPTLNSDEFNGASYSLYTPKKVYFPSESAHKYEETPLLEKLSKYSGTELHYLINIELCQCTQYGDFVGSSYKLVPNDAVLPFYNYYYTVEGRPFTYYYSYYAKDDVDFKIRIAIDSEILTLSQLLNIENGANYDLMSYVKRDGETFTLELGHPITKTMIIEPKLAEIMCYEIEDQSWEYGDSYNVVFYGYPITQPENKKQYFFVSGFFNSKTPAGVYKADLNSCSNLAEVPTTRFVKPEATITVNKAPLTISCGSYQRVYMTPNPAPEKIEIFIAGLKNDDSQAEVGRPTISFEADITSPVGTYEIILSDSRVPGNYYANYVSGTLNIIKADQRITWNQEFEQTKVGDEITLNATLSSGLPVEYSLSNNDDVAELDGNVIRFLREGSVDINATQPGNENYNGFSMFKTAYVSVSSGIEDLTSDNVLSIGVENRQLIVNGATDSEIVRVFTLSGATVYEGISKTISLTTGIYIVQVSNLREKVVVK